MKNIVQTLVFICLAVGLTLLLSHFFCSRDKGLQELEKKIAGQIDSLNNLINIKEDSLLAIRARAAALEGAMAKLDSSVKKQKIIIKELESRRFIYDGTENDLYRELNDLYKRALAQDSSATDRIP